jgi:hypothetical protein
VPLGITAQALLEIAGILSFNVPSAQVALVPSQVTAQYRLTVFPDFQHHPDYAGCTVQELIAQMSRQMALGDAVQAVQVELFAPLADCLLTWNAKHFAGKVSIPVMTPEDWWNQRAASIP